MKPWIRRSLFIACVYAVFIVAAAYFLLTGCDNPSTGFIASGLMGLALLLSLLSTPLAGLTGIIWILSFRFKKLRSYRRKLAWFFWLLTAFITTTLILWITQDMYSSHKRGVAEKLVDAVESYEQEAGRAPKSLSQLNPKYLSETPKTFLGQEPKYYARGSHSYVISYADCAWLTCRYDSQVKRWVCDD